MVYLPNRRKMGGWQSDPPFLFYDNEFGKIPLTSLVKIEPYG